MRRRLLSLSLATALLCTLALGGTGAVPILGPHDAVDEHVHLQPADGPNGEYARFDADGDLALDLTAANPAVDGEGVAPGTVTTVDDVFTVTYNGSENATVWITGDLAAVTYVAADRSIQSPETAVTLGPGESVAVGLRVNATGGTVAGDGAMRVHARLAEADDGGDGGGSAPVVDSRGTDSPTAEPAVGTQVSVVRAGDRYEVEVTAARAGDAVEVPFGGSDANVRLESVRFVPTRDGDFPMVARESDVDDFETGGVPDATAVGFLRIDHAWSDAAVRDVAIDFSVRNSWLESRGVAPEDVVLYRFTGDGWTELETTVTGRHGDRYHFTAPTPGLSVFALAAESPPVASGDTVSTPATTDAAGGTAAPVPREPGRFRLLPVALVAVSLVFALLGLRRYQRDREA